VANLAVRKRWVIVFNDRVEKFGRCLQLPRQSLGGRRVMRREPTTLLDAATHTITAELPRHLQCAR
jgi:hypothetical protein